MTSEQARKNREELFRLIRGNPDLPIVPFVDAEIIADDSGYWMGSWGNASVDEYIIPGDDRPVIYKSDDDVFDTLEKLLSNEEFEALPEDEAECRAVYEALPWTKAIIVYIGLPE